MDFSFFIQLLIIFSLSVPTIAIYHRLKIPDTLAYLSVGLLLGASPIVDTSHDISLLAEIGVVFLLFSLGLEFSLAHMLAMRRIVFGLGGLQVLITALLIGIVGITAGFSIESTFVMAAGLALSSTAIVSKELSRRNEVRTVHGQLTIGTLIFQDIAAVIFIIIVSGFGVLNHQALVESLLLTLGKGVAFIATLLLLGRKIMPRLFNEIAKTRSEELFVLAVIVTVLVAAFITHLLSLSMALGGFVAGMMLGESHFRHQIKADIRPFKDILLGLFFVSIGLMMNLEQFTSHWDFILLAVLGLISLKASLVAVLSYLLVHDARNAVKTGLALAQGGEFCFALVAIASQNDILRPNVAALILSITVVSMAITPILMRYSDRIAAFFIPKKLSTTKSLSADALSKEVAGIKEHIMICGYGRVGQTISRFLEKDSVPFVALDDDILRISEASKAGIPVYYGDCRRIEILLAAGLKRAKMVVICIHSASESLEILKNIRLINSTISILVKTRDDSMMEELLENGATQVVPEVLESSLVIVSNVLSMLGQPEVQIQKRLTSARQKHYRMLHNYFFGLNEKLIDTEGKPKKFMHAVSLPESAYSVGLSLFQVKVGNSGAKVESVCRGEKKVAVSWNIPLLVGDLIMLSGTPEQIEHAEKILLSGH